MALKPVPVDLAVNLQTRRTSGASVDGVVVEAGLWNCYVELTAEGNSVIKRPGASIQSRAPQGYGQGIFSVDGQTWQVISDVLYRVDAAASPVAIPSVTVAGQEFRFVSDALTGLSLLQSPTGLWTFTTGNVITKVTDADYPALTVPGVVMLDGTVYVMGTDGTVYGSDIQAPTSWNALNFIKADPGLGTPRNLHRHLNYVVAVCATGTQLFYDAANATGSPLAPVDNAVWKVGAVQNSVCLVVDDTFLLAETPATSKAGGYQVIQVTGLQMSIVSNPHVDRLLSSLSGTPTVYSYGCTVAGHTFFILTLYDIGLTLAYDVNMKHWNIWSSGYTSATTTAFSEIHYYRGYLQNIADGTVKVFAENAFVDQSGFSSLPWVVNDFAVNGGAGAVAAPWPINVQLLIPPVDFKTLQRKFLPALYLIADTTNSNLAVSWSDDDGQTYSTPRMVDLSTAKKMLQRCGSSRRRSWKITHSDAVPLRLYSMELEVQGGVG